MFLMCERRRIVSQDSLTPVAAFAEASLGEAHPVAGMVQELAEANLSTAVRSARRERLRLAEVSQCPSARAGVLRFTEGEGH